MAGVLAIIMSLGIPIVAIICATYIKSKKMDSQNALGPMGFRKDFMALKKENEELKRRIENIEMIVTDPELLQMDHHSQQNLSEQKNAFPKRQHSAF